MSDYRIKNDHDAHTIVLNSLVKDIAHILGWLVIGLGVLALSSTVNAVIALLDDRWVAFGWYAFCTVVMGSAAIDTARRAARYTQGRRA